VVEGGWVVDVAVDGADDDVGAGDGGVGQDGRDG